MNKEREKPNAYELDIFQKSLLRISASYEFKEQNSKAVNVTFLRESPRRYVLWIKVTESTPYICSMSVHHLFSRKTKVSYLLDKINLDI